MARFNEDRSWYVFSCSGFEIICMASDIAGLVMDWHGLMVWIDWDKDVRYGKV